MPVLQDQLPARCQDNRAVAELVTPMHSAAPNAAYDSLGRIITQRRIFTRYPFGCGEGSGKHNRLALGQWAIAALYETSKKSVAFGRSRRPAPRSRSWALLSA
jgi:hypothetical protein